MKSKQSLTTTQQNLAQRDTQVIWHPYTQIKNMALPIAIVGAKNTLLFTQDNKTIIDAISSWWVTIHGHSNKHIAQKIYQQAQQLEQVIFAGFTHQPAVELAEKLIEILPNNSSKIFYSDNGSTAVEVAIKMALQFWWNKSNDTKRNKIIAFKNSYHGDTFGSMSISQRSVFTMAFDDKLFDVIFIDTPTKENLSSLKKIIEQHRSTVAAFIYEPLVQGAGGMKMYDATLLQQLLSFVKKQNIICIADEVMTGFGRTGKLFASQYQKTQPDIICLSKGLTGGTMALGVTACTKKIHQAFISNDKLKTFFHGHSFTANPIACAASIASLQLLQKTNCQQKINWLSQQHLLFIKKIEGNMNIKNARSLGTILAFELISNHDGYLNNIATSITQQALQQGVYIRPLGNTIYIMPPYCITKKELQKVYLFLLSIIK